MKKTQAFFMHRLAYITAACFAWSFIWLITQSLFMTRVPFLSNMLVGEGASYETVEDFIKIICWCVAVVAVATLMWAKWSKGDFRFLQFKWWVLISYTVLLIPAILLATEPDILGMPGWLQVVCMIVGTAVQILPTFGFLQTALETWSGKLVAACLTATMFALGHFVWMGSFDLVIAVGAAVFAFARMKTATVYLTHALHLGFYWLMLFMHVYG